MVGLLRTGEIGKPVMATNMTHLAPLTWRGFCLATPPLLCKDGAGLSANLLGVVAHNLSDGVAGLASPPPSVGCPAPTQRSPLVHYSCGQVLSTWLEDAA